MNNSGIKRKDIMDFALSNFGTTGERLWAEAPDYEVLRHPCGKWYGIVMNVRKNKLGIASEEFADILVCKCEPVLREMLRETQGFLPAYHMNKEHWITVMLDGSVEKNPAFHVLSESYRLLNKKAKKTKQR